MSGEPQGRAGRLWLRQRIELAESAAELLQRKLSILLDERDRMRLLAARTEKEWHRRCAETDEALLRTALLGGRRVLPPASGGLAKVTVEHTESMGVSHPARVVFEPPADAVRALGGTVLAPARRACRAALEAACAHAAATAAAAVLDAEVAATRQRVRAIERRRLPALRAALTRIEFALEEREREDGARLRRLSRRECP
ncbi:V-type ATP synthase subunit D [Actinomadura bangladeshensis]|uniref:V-type ATPase, D subunit n=1 Tax=Actinomadura bangladeshensis TaxID=453573 RepID=A0A4R4P1N4_9ACTN|nr:V-type ATP synthase subunit D [Actinomadura bangladeshensis]TDC16161.1 V-type ATPase, D subunit [Actinomadura bangladeshensis]